MKRTGKQEDRNKREEEEVVHSHSSRCCSFHGSQSINYENNNNIKKGPPLTAFAFSWFAIVLKEMTTVGQPDNYDNIKKVSPLTAFAFSW